MLSAEQMRLNLQSNLRDRREFRARQSIVVLLCAIAGGLSWFPQTVCAVTDQKGLAPPPAARYAIVVGIGAYPQESRLRTLRWGHE
jgi:hypothetical protein